MELQDHISGTSYLLVISLGYWIVVAKVVRVHGFHATLGCTAQTPKPLKKGDMEIVIEIYDELRFPLLAKIAVFAIKKIRLKFIQNFPPKKLIGRIWTKKGPELPK